MSASLLALWEYERSFCAMLVEEKHFVNSRVTLFNVTRKYVTHIFTVVTRFRFIVFNNNNANNDNNSSNYMIDKNVYIKSQK